jgi:apolipoprotein N-acyltransferase
LIIGPIGTYHEQGNILRAVENGFTLFRCVSQGVSGIFEPTLNSVLTQKVASNIVEKYLFYLPIQKRVATLYGYIGDSVSYLCLLTSAALLYFTYRKSRRHSQLSL